MTEQQFWQRLHRQRGLFYIEEETGYIRRNPSRLEVMIGRHPRGIYLCPLEAVLPFWHRQRMIGKAYEAAAMTKLPLSACLDIMMAADNKVGYFKPATRRRLLETLGLCEPENERALRRVF